jgi:hypothetical protein
MIIGVVCLACRVDLSRLEFGLWGVTDTIYSLEYLVHGRLELWDNFLIILSSIFFSAGNGGSSQAESLMID